MKQKIVIVPSLMALVLLMLGCQAPVSTSTASDTAKPCSLSMVSGDVKVTYQCNASMIYDGAGKQTNLSITLVNDMLPTDPNLTAAISIARTPQVGSFMISTPGVTGIVELNYQNKNDTWIADTASSNIAERGSFVVYIQNVGDPYTLEDSDYYSNTHGILDAVLVPSASGQVAGNVTVHAEF
jgi:hypothetical protein